MLHSQNSHSFTFVFKFSAIYVESNFRVRKKLGFSKIFSLQKIPTMSGFPGQSMTPGYSSSPQIPADIWATPTPVQHPPPPPQAAPRAPPGLQGIKMIFFRYKFFSLNLSFYYFFDDWCVFNLFKKFFF